MYKDILTHYPLQQSTGNNPVYQQAEMVKYIITPIFNWKLFSYLKDCLEKHVTHGTIYNLT